MNKRISIPWQKIPTTIKRILKAHKANFGIDSKNLGLEKEILDEVNAIFYHGVKHGYEEVIKSLPKLY